MMKKKPTISEAFANGAGIKFFQHMASLPYVEKLTPVALSYAYFFNRSGGKYCSRFVQSLNRPNGILDDTEISLLAETVQSLYRDNWDRIWDALIVDYGILDNTDAHVKQTTTTTRDSSDTRTSESGKNATRDTKDTNTSNTSTNYGRTTTTEHNNTEDVNNSTTLNNENTETLNTTNSTEESTTYGKTTTTENTATDKNTNTTTYGKTQATTGTDGHETTNTKTYGKTENHNTSQDVGTDRPAFDNASMSRIEEVHTTGNESVTMGGTDTETVRDTLTHNVTVTDGGTDNTTVNGTHTENATVTDGGTDTHTSTTTEGGTITNAYNGTDTLTGTTTTNGTDTTTDGGTDSTEKNDTFTGKETLNENTTETDTNTHIYRETVDYVEERKGNIGVTTSQQMLEGELMLRAKHHMMEYMFRDIDQVLTIPMYG